ncbi:MAG TPA: ATP synthase F0 subunit B [Oscillatoriaceae cyanobacterium]
MLELNLTLLVQMGLFLVFAWLLNLVFFRPVTRVISERQAYVAAERQKADAALKQVQDLQADYETRLKDAHVLAQDAIHAAVKEAEAKRHTLLEQVKRDVEQEVVSAREAIRSERQSAIASLEGEVGQFADLIKHKVLGGTPAYSSAGGNES